MATKARLHWFWRAMIAAVLGAACLPPVSFILNYYIINRMGWYLSIGIRLAIPFGYGLISTVAGIAIYAYLRRHYGPATPDGETHCRHCDYILRGISEPRCPECGEAI
jgi:hypothetical protein